jgi:Trk K+ transport system NAD-binding subunit
VIIGWLGIITLTLVIVAAIILTILRVTGVNGGGKLDIQNAFWQSLLRVLDTGTFANDTKWVARLVGLFMTLVGILIAGSLIGLIANALDQRIERLRRGRSQVIEHDHSLILGWSQRVPAIVRELVIANESRSHAAVVVVAEKEKEEMEQELHDYVGDTKTTRLVCRTGEPWLPQNLHLANLAEARSVVVINDGSDAAAVKAVLAIRAAAADRGVDVTVVAELNRPDTIESLSALLGDRLVAVSSDAVVAEMTAQACRKGGFSAVFRELLDFDGDELYFESFPALDGRTYAECQMAFDRCAVVGIADAQGVHLNPPGDTPYRAGDELIAIAEDDSTFVASATPSQGRLLEVEDVQEGLEPRRIVITGWSELGWRVVAELDEYFDDRSTVHVLIDPTYVDVTTVRSRLSTQNVRLEVTELVGGPEVVAKRAAEEAFHEVIVLGYRDTLERDDADARTLLTLLAFGQLRQEQPERGPARQIRLVAELLDQRNAPLAQATGADDFIVSDELTSLMIAQLSERQQLHQVFDDLFDRSGSSIEMHPAAMFGAHHASTFGDVVVTASARGHSAIGYRLARTGQVVVNPAKSSAIQLDRDDEVIVVGPPLSQPARVA